MLNDLVLNSLVWTACRIRIFHYLFGMKILAISGSTRQLSTNTALLSALQALAQPDIEIDVFDRIGELPVFSPDLEGPNTPESVIRFIEKVSASDGLIISSPEYVRSIPGGLKNAIDWLVSGEAVIGKPIALAHASHRGEDMLAGLRTVLSTVSSNFSENIFFRFPVMKQAPDAIRESLMTPANRSGAEKFLKDFAAFCQSQLSEISGAIAI
jgi:chromate reductase, NAD(P)H dehydrogenase (quinone)